MVEDKENELKEALAKDYTQQEIENRLKDQIKNASQNREQFDRKKSIKNNPYAQKMLKNKKKQNFNILLAILLVIAGLLIFIAIYLFNSKTPIKKSVERNPDKKEKNYFKQLYNSKNYDTYKCYAFKNGKISFPIKECKKDFDEFLLKNRTANRFEIVPIISENDSIIYNNIKNNLEKEPEDLQNKIKEYLNIGLSNERVLESAWYIKKSLGEDTIISSSKYYVKSEKPEEQGVIIRAYH